MRKTAVSVISGTLASALESGQSFLAPAASFWNSASLMPGTRASSRKLIRSISNPLPKSLRLFASRPNPAHGSADLHFQLPRSERVLAEIFDIQARTIRTLGSGQALDPGEQVLRWDGRDDAGAPVPNGISLIRLKAGGESAVIRIVLLR